MNALIPAHVALVEPEVEGSVLGTIIVHPEALAAGGVRLDVDWFEDPATRLFAEAILRLHRDGHRLTGPALLAGVSPAAESDGATRAQLLARLMSLAVPVPYLSGAIATLRDRWARRLLKAAADHLAADAVAIETDPLNAASVALRAIDEVTVSARSRHSGSIAASADVLFERIAAGEDLVGATTGLRLLDGALNGYRAGRVYVIGARPGMGKSALMCSSLRRTAEAGNGVLIFSLEMDGDEIAARCIADAIDDPAGPWFSAILRGQWALNWTEAITDARNRLQGLPMQVDATPRLTMAEIAARARSHKARLEATGKRLAVVCIDHIGLVEPSDRYAGNRVAETGEVSRAAKVLAKELGCCVLLLCQLSRNVEGRDDKRPSLADLRWSGDIEQDADVVAFLYRPEYYLAQDPKIDPDELEASRHQLELLIRKNRSGQQGDIRLWCSIAHNAIRDGRA